MKKKLVLAVAMVAIIALALASVALSQVPQPAVSGDDNHPIRLAAAPPPAVPPSAPDSTILYFVPVDLNQSTTVLSLYNTGDVTATVTATGYRQNGAADQLYSVQVPPHVLLRVVSDPLPAGAPAGWGNAVLWNYTGLTAYVRLILPAGVNADGFTAWTAGSMAPFDPNKVVTTVGLRFEGPNPPTPFPAR